jgi:hypothetical protein
VLAAGNGADNGERLFAGDDGVRQERIRRDVGEILLVAVEPQERDALLNDRFQGFPDFLCRFPLKQKLTLALILLCAAVSYIGTALDSLELRDAERFGCLAQATRGEGGPQ